MTSSRIYFFRSVEGLCPDIELKRNVPLILGRGPLCRVKDSKVSRHQLRVTWDDEGIRLKQLGENQSYIRDRPLFKGENMDIDEGEIVYLVSNRFPFKLLLKTDFICTSKNDHQKTEDNLQHEKKAVPKRRKRDSDSAVKINRAMEGGPPSQKPESNKYQANNKNFRHALLASMNDPSLKVLKKEDHVVIKDKFPKARHHYLVLPIERIDTLQSLEARHAPLLSRMCETGRSLTLQHPKSQFRIGFHAVPSMSQIHLHVISQDFDSPCLKTKKHWNSFTTAFFLNPEEVIDKLRSKGKFSSPPAEDIKKWMTAELSCHKCHNKPSNFPELKRHLICHDPQNQTA